MTRLILCALLFTSAAAHASTFVGNGGNAGDVELLVALKQIEASTESISQGGYNKLCECDSTFEGHQVCEVLRSLNAAQKQYCRNFVLKEAADYAALLNSQKIRYLWTHDDIEVIENKRTRAVEAVANPETNEITLNRKRFIELNVYERIFLMAHELTHLIDVDGKHLNDEEPIGPFEGVTGTRNLINAVAATVVMQAAETNLISQYKPALERAKGHKKFWIDFLGGNRAMGSIQGSKTFGFDSSANTSLVGVRYYLLNSFGLYLAYRGVSAEKKILTAISAEEEIETFSVGITYKYFPFKDPLKYLGQSHLEIYGGPDLLKATYKVHDPFVGTQDKDDSLGFLLGATYRLPVIWGFWFNVGASAEMHKYKYEQVNVEYSGPQFTSYFGASYGF